MIDHTPEPWKWHAQGEANEYCMLTHDGRWVIAFRQNGELTDERQKANARRIAACVNRLAGFKTEDIENPACDITGHGALLSKLIYIEMQRDRLLAALNLIETDKDGDGFICREAMEQVREAIAQAEEGAGQ
jgi:hypothetical protein